MEEPVEELRYFPLNLRGQGWDCSRLRFLPLQLPNWLGIDLRLLPPGELRNRCLGRAEWRLCCRNILRD